MHPNPPSASLEAGPASAPPADPIDPDIDPLTGLWTRPALHRLLGQAMTEASGQATRPALLALDLDRFQAINDATGIATGDGVLARVARRITGAVPPGTLVARISGDEFAVLLRDARQADAAAARLLELIGRPYAVKGHGVVLSVSIGVAEATPETQDADALLRAANIALHRAEAQGKNRWCRFEPWMQDQAQARQALEIDLRAALALNQAELRRTMVVDQFSLHYQPQVSLDGRRLLGFEALARWQHPRQGWVGPAQFIPLAEEIGLIGLLGDWVLRSACRAAAGWPVHAGHAPLRVAVNVSALQLRERRALVASVAEALAGSGLAPDRLELEITESALIGDVLGTLQAIRAMGVHLSLDDFGTGYSSLSQLARFPFDGLKIDHSFVQRLPGGAEPDAQVAALSQRMLQGIAALGNGLGMRTTAEGVETPAQAALVGEAGCAAMQGFLITPPVPADAVAALIDRFHSTTGAAAP